MSDLDKDLLHSYLRTAPAPAPWYARGPVQGVMRKGKTLQWTSLESDPEGTSVAYTVLTEEQLPEKDGPGFPLLMLKTGVTVGTVEGNRLLVAGKLRTPEVLDLHLYRGDNLLPISNLAAARQALVAPDRTHYAASGPLVHVQIPRRLAAGKSPFRFPALFAGVGEFIIPTTLHKPGAPPNAQESSALIVFRPHDHEIEVIPQDWLNGGDYRAGLQWITRAARDPLSKQIVGEGMRLGTFVLKPEGMQIDRWLVQDEHHMPQQ